MEKKDPKGRRIVEKLLLFTIFQFRGMLSWKFLWKPLPAGKIEFQGGSDFWTFLIWSCFNGYLWLFLKMFLTTAPSLFDHWLLYRHCAKLVNTREILNGEPISFPREYFYQTKRISSDSCNLWRLTRIQRVENEQKTRSLTFFKRQNLPFCITQTLEISFCSGLLSITWNELLNMTGIKTDVWPPRNILTWHRG